MSFQFEFWPTEFRHINQLFGANPQNYVQFNLPGHEGVDIMAPTGSRIFAVAPGTVTRVHTNPDTHNYGIHVRVRHIDGYQTIYAHLESVNVEPNQMVQAGSVLGRADNTGNSFGSHLHLTLKKDGASFDNYPSNIIDPTPFLLPLLGWHPPAGPYVEGFAYVPALIIIDQLAQTAAGGVNLRSRPRTDSRRLGLITGGSLIILTAEPRGQYVAVRVPTAAITLEDPNTPTVNDNAPPPPPPPPPEPNTNMTNGWVATTAITINDNNGTAGPFGLNLRAEPNRNGRNLGFIPAHTTFTVTGPNQGEYTPIRVANNQLQPPFGTAPPPPTNEDAEEPVINNPEQPMLGQVDLGLHTAIDQPITPAEIHLFEQARPTLIKAIATQDPAQLALLAQNHPSAQWIIRTHLDLHRQTVSPADYLAATLTDVQQATSALGDKEYVIELHHKPNKAQNGLGSSWQTGEEFNQWFLELLTLYRAALPTAKFIYPGLSPGGTVTNFQIDYIQFIEASRPAVEAADGLGVHTYWSHVQPMAESERAIADYIGRFRFTPIWITEASNKDPQLSGTRKARQYLQFWRNLQTHPTVRGVAFFVASAQHPRHANEAWLDKDIAPIIGSR
ncbi:MAG TPA: peptidoglycan DD-metalloendopeptidase family protein [Anaerolineae bacterium]|nr:peptidoglycan DD-metalloendopeptidase family protein [Anaerolineae bacterium]